MNLLSSDVLDWVRHDWDAREVRLRQVIEARLAEQPAPAPDDSVVATYFLSLRSWNLRQAAAEISYHATSGTKDVPPGSLLEECTGRLLGVDPWDPAGQCGLIHIGFPVKMLLNAEGGLTSCDILHTAAGAILFDVFENQDSRLVALNIPPAVTRSFPGPAHGPQGLRNITSFGRRPMFGTILKPTAGITASDVGQLVDEIAGCDLFCFVKEDENLYPRLPYSPVKDRARAAVEAVKRHRDSRNGLGLVFAPHISGAPHEILDSLHGVLEAGALGVMLSETFAGGTVRMVREATRAMSQPPFIYGHNAGIGVKTRSIWREVIDLLARLDGIDFRQTAPVRPGTPFLKPYGAEWLASESILSRPIEGIRPTTVVRAGALDQGNIGLNLADAERRGIQSNVLFLSGSAINSIKNSRHRPDPILGAEAMRQAISIHREGAIAQVPDAEHTRALADLAQRRHLRELTTALHQRYPDLPSGVS